jgi:hypothetical protein
MPTLKQIQNFIARLRLRKTATSVRSLSLAEIDANTLIPRQNRGRRNRKQSLQPVIELRLATLLNESFLHALETLKSVVEMGDIKSEIKEEQGKIQ